MNTLKGRLTILADNVVAGKNESLGEHGFSVYLETEKGNFLFDTGKGKTLVHNAIVFKKDLRALKKIIMSHGHGDHTGGLPEVLRFHHQIDVMGHPDIFLDRFRVDDKGIRQYGGIPYKRGFLEKCGARFVFNEKPVEIEQGLFLTGEVPRQTPFEFGDMDNRFGIRQGEVVPETIPDDQSLVIQTANGILIVLGCAHSGTINVIDHAVRMTGTDRIFGIMGGTHLDFSGDEQLEQTIQALKTYRIAHLIPAHCTGISVAARLHREFPESFQFAHVGKVLEF